MRKGKMEKGITLIALILTIVILLILAIVAINSIANDGLLGKTEEITNNYNQSVKNEQYILKSYESFLNNHVVSNGKETLVGLYLAGKLHDGDYVDYKPSKNEDDSLKTYKPDGETKGSLTGYTDGDLQVIEQEDLNWRVLGYDSSKNELLLISEAPTSNQIIFYEATGYNNYEDVLNNTCKALYGNTSIGAIARSITMDDVHNYFLVGTNYTKEEFKSYSRVDTDNTAPVEYGYRNESINSKFSYDNKTNKVTRADTETTVDLTSNEYAFYASNVIKDTIKLEILLGKEGTYNYDIASRSVYIRRSRERRVRRMGC